MPSLATPIPAASFLLLMLTMEVKHFAADFLLQSSWMAQGKARERGWTAPLGVHAGLHGLGTLAIALAVAPTLWWLGLVDGAIHAAIDRGKALAGRRWCVPITDARFWWLVGFDQFLHQLTGLGLVGALALA